MVLDHAVVDEPTAAGRVRMVVAVVLAASPCVAQRQWPITTVAPRHRSRSPRLAVAGPGRLKVWMVPSASSHASPNAWWPRRCVSTAIRRRRARSGPRPSLVMNPKIPHIVVLRSWIASGGGLSPRALAFRL